MRSRWPRKSTLTCWMTPLVSILRCKGATGWCGECPGRGAKGTTGSGTSRLGPVSARGHALLRLELLHDLQELVIHALVVAERLLHRPARAKVTGGTQGWVSHCETASAPRLGPLSPATTPPARAATRPASHGCRRHCSRACATPQELQARGCAPKGGLATPAAPCAQACTGCTGCPGLHAPQVVQRVGSRQPAALGSHWGSSPLRLVDPLHTGRPGAILTRPLHGPR